MIQHHMAENIMKSSIALSDETGQTNNMVEPMLPGKGVKI